jgi:hypothetical protein
MKQSKKSSQCAHSTFKQGFLTALASPILFISGAFSRLPVRHISTVDDAWADVGQIMRSSAENYRRRDERKRA